MGPDRKMVLVNSFAPDPWIPQVNAELATFAEAHDNVVIADWHGSIEPHQDLLAGDLTHPDFDGGYYYADAVRAAIQQLQAGG